jgi:hypothetical protein
MRFERCAFETRLRHSYKDAHIHLWPESYAYHSNVVTIIAHKKALDQASGGRRIARPRIHNPISSISKEKQALLFAFVLAFPELKGIVHVRHDFGNAAGVARRENSETGTVEHRRVSEKG